MSSNIYKREFLRHQKHSKIPQSINDDKSNKSLEGSQGIVFLLVPRIDLNGICKACRIRKAALVHRH